MSIWFRNVTVGPLHGFTAEAPAGAVVGLTGEDGAAIETLMQAAAGVVALDSGTVEGQCVVMDHTMSRLGPVARVRQRAWIDALRRAGKTVLLSSQEPRLLMDVADEVWWIDSGRLAGQGDPAEVLDSVARHSLAGVRQWAANTAQPLQPSLRRGDGRARIESLEVLNSAGQPTLVWTSGEKVAVRVTVRFEAGVDDPVVGIMIRTRIGFEVFGTNTELEKLRLGPVAAGEARRVRFDFDCSLCPQEYTLTAASHDPDGTWHDWMEDAVAFSVVDSRYTAGVANLRATASVEE